MDGQVLGVETHAYAMTNPQNTSDSKDPLKWGFFITKIGLSELCQKKTGILVFSFREANHGTFENIELLKWCTHQELNLKPADP